MKEKILNLVDDLVADLLYYGRKEDGELPLGSIEKAIEDGEITEQDIVTQFHQSFSDGIKN